MSKPNLTSRRVRGLRVGHLLLAAAWALTATAPAWASGPAGTGLVAEGEDAIDAANNPAALSRIEQPEWAGALQGLLLDSTDQARSSGGAQTTESSSSDVLIPSVYYAQPIDDRFAFGISLTVPGGVGSDPGDKSIARYLLDKWSLGYVSLAPAASYRVNDKVSLGAALNLNFSQYTYETKVFNGPDTRDGQMKLTDNDFSVGFRLGAMYQVTPSTRLGATYHSSSTSNFSSKPELSGLTPEREQALEIAGVRNQTVKLETRFPQAVLVGGYHEFANHASAAIDVAWIDFSNFGLSQATLADTTVNTSKAKYEDIWGVSTGLNWPVNDRWTAQFGALYASSGVSDQNRTWTLRLDRVWGLGAGAEYHWSQDLIAQFGLSYFDLGDAPIGVDVPALGSLSASYSSNNAVGLNLSLRWLRPRGN